MVKKAIVTGGLLLTLALSSVSLWASITPSPAVIKTGVIMFGPGGNQCYCASIDLTCGPCIP